VSLPDLEVVSSRNELDLEAVIKVEEQRFVDFAFIKGYGGRDKHPIYVVTQRELFNHQPFGYTSRINITLDNNKYMVKFSCFPCGIRNNCQQ